MDALSPVQYAPAPTEDDGYDFMYRVVLVGDSGVGKTSLLMRFADDLFTGSHISTIGADVKIRTVRVGDFRVKLQIWDTAGQDRFDAITSSYFRGADAVLLVYSVDDRTSLERIQGKWLPNMMLYSHKDPIKILVGNKCDLQLQRRVSQSEGAELADAIGAQEFMEVSSKRGDNVEKAFVDLAKQMMEKERSTRSLKDGSGDRKGTFKLSSGGEAIPIRGSGSCPGCALM